MTNLAFQPLVDVFDRQLRDRMHLGAQLVVRHRGEVVVDESAGLRRISPPLRVTPATPFMNFSVTKAFAGVCVHKLIEEGKIELDAPVAEYWPEFGQKGKETATIRHVFLHQAGVPSQGMYTQALVWPNWSLVTKNVARLPAEYAPGTKTAYHLVNYGFILGEVVRRVSGMRIDQYLKKNFLDPLGLKNTALGLPLSWYPQSSGLYFGTLEGWDAVVAFNLPVIRSAVMPAATLNSTAHDLSVFYQMLINGGTYNGVRLLQPETIETAVQLGSDGYDHIVGDSMRWALGFHLGGRPGGESDESLSGMGKGSTVRTFGHFGMGTCMAWADPDEKLVVAFTCNRLLAGDKGNVRWIELSNAVWDCVRTVSVSRS